MATRLDAWRWLCCQVLDEIDRPDWKHAEFVGAIHCFSVGTLRDVARFEYPLYVSHGVAGEPVQLHNVADRVVRSLTFGRSISHPMRIDR